jgi:hypothetical protein
MMLPTERASAAEVVKLYRMRWQIELAFKRLKSLGGFAALRAREPQVGPIGGIHRPNKWRIGLIENVWGEGIAHSR